MLTAVVVAVVLVVLFVAGRAVLLTIGVTEGDVPAAADLPLPTGSAVVGHEEECASGGCWTVLLVEPPTGTSPEELAATVSASGPVRGTLWDPRSVWVDARVEGRFVRVQATYRSDPALP